MTYICPIFGLMWILTYIIFKKKTSYKSYNFRFGCNGIQKSGPLIIYYLCPFYCNRWANSLMESSIHLGTFEKGAQMCNYIKGHIFLLYIPISICSRYNYFTHAIYWYYMIFLQNTLNMMCLIYDIFLLFKNFDMSYSILI